MEDKMVDIQKNLATLMKINHKFMRNFNPEHKHSLKPREFRILMSVHHFENKRMSFYAERVALEKGSFTYCADNLEKKGLIERNFSENDKRKTILSLTEKGKKVVEKSKLEFNNYAKSQLSKLNPEDVKKLNKALSLISEIDFNF